MLFLVVVVFGSVLLIDQFDPRWVLLPGLSSVVAVFGSFLALILIIMRLAQLRTAKRLRGAAAAIPSLQSLYVRAQQTMQVLAVCGHFVLLFGTSWPTDVRGLVGESRAGLDELVILIPFVIYFVVGYWRLYAIDRAIREVMTEELVYLAEPVRPIWTRIQYVSFQVRFHLLLVAVPLMIIIMAKDLLEPQRGRISNVLRPILDHFGLAGVANFGSEFALGIIAAVVLLCSPILIRLVWYCRPLAKGSLRDRLEHIARQAGLRYRDILLWPTYGVIVNAAVVGVFGRLRYIMLSDGLIESLTDGHIEAVFAHEVGHVKHHHLPFLMLFSFAGMGLLALAAQHIQSYWRLDSRTVEIGFFAAVALMWFFLFGRLSRAFERQADLFAAESLSRRFDGRALGCGYDGCLRHGSRRVSSVLDYPPLCLAASELVCSALDRAAGMNAIPRTARTWRHGSIADRCQTILRLAHDLPAVVKFKIKIGWLKIVILLAALLAAAWGIVTPWTVS